MDVGRMPGELVLEDLDGRMESVQIVEGLTAAGPLDLRQPLIANAVAREALALVGRILAPGDARLAELGPDFTLAQIEKRPHDIHGGVSGLGAQGRTNASATLEPGQAREFGASHPAHHEGFEGVVGVVAGGDRSHANLTSRCGQGAVARLAGTAFEIGGSGIQFDPHAPEGDRQTGGQTGAEVRIGAGFGAPQAVIHMDSPDLGPVQGGSDQMQKEDRIGTAGEGHHQGLLGVQISPAGQSCPAQRCSAGEIPGEGQRVCG